MNHTHVSDDHLIDVCLAIDDLDPASRSGWTADRPEWTSCAQCRSRHAALADMLTDVRTAATLEADAAFPADRLARQRSRIMQRLETEGRPGRVITFPAGAHPQELSLRRTRPASRWIAAAAAAAFVVGLLAGHLVHSLPAASAPLVQSRAASVPSPSRPFLAVVSDDEFLGQVELAAGRTSPAPLRALDALTPRAWDVR
jgi:hypothetical protein